MNDSITAPRAYKGVMVSSTFTDLKEHRAALIKAIKGQGLTDVAMENDAARADLDIIDSSLRMVRDCSAYIGVISRKYGQTPECPIRNPSKISITELEFKEAQRLSRPILIFIMGEKHAVIEADVETNTTKRKKLGAFRERAKRMNPEASVHRVYATFDSLEDFREKVVQSVAELRRHLEKQVIATGDSHALEAPSSDSIPIPPTFYAEPPYIGSHQFLGRKAELDTMNDWASAADPHAVLLFEAIGGAGKSLLTWEWTTNHANKVRDDWAGRFWYSFYERGALLSDFCQRALAYMTGQPLRVFHRRKAVELGELLLRQLQLRPWLVILDGLERVLVAYHRFDAAQIADHQIDTSEDQIANRDTCSAIHPEDDDILRGLAAALPSKVLITTRLTPRILLNPSSQGIQGVLRVSLPGLRPSDAEALLRSCGVTGNSNAIQAYLKRHCDCHPLVTGVLAGLINNYLPNRGDFDAWANDRTGGGQLNLAKLDLVQKRNHILRAALAALPEKSRQLLSTLALLSEAVDYATLKALNPHLPAEPEEVKVPLKPEQHWRWDEMSDEQKEEVRQKYELDLQRRKEYEKAVNARLESPEWLAAPDKLAKTVRDIEGRGFLQYDVQTKRYDLHPVVRGIAAGRLRQREKEQYGQRVVDHFSQKAHNPYQEAESLEDLRDGLHVVRTLLQMGRYDQACDSYSSDLRLALTRNLESHHEILALIRPFFPEGWGKPPTGVNEVNRNSLITDAANALSNTGEINEALTLYELNLVSELHKRNWYGVGVDLRNISVTLVDLNRLAKSGFCRLRALDLAVLTDSTEALFKARIRLFWQMVRTGQWPEAESMWKVLEGMGRNFSRSLYVPGDLEEVYGWFCFYRGHLTEEQLAQAEELARSARNRPVVRDLHDLRGKWNMNKGAWMLAADCFKEAVRMAREVGQFDISAETNLALARLKLNQLPNARHEAEQLSLAKHPSHLVLAELWLEIGDHQQASKHALSAYKEAWADGEPHVWRYDLDKATALLERLGVEIPLLPPYDEDKDQKLSWEDQLVTAIEELRASKESKKPKPRKSGKPKRAKAKNKSRKS